MCILHKVKNFFEDIFSGLTPVTRFILKWGIITVTLMLSAAFILSGIAGVYTDYHSTVIIRDELIECMKRTFGLFLFSALFSQWLKK